MNWSKFSAVFDYYQKYTSCTNSCDSTLTIDRLIDYYVVRFSRVRTPVSLSVSACIIVNEPCQLGFVTNVTEIILLPVFIQR